MNWPALIALVAGLAMAWGLFFDTSIRRDPFGGPTTPWEWATTRQPARELEAIPVVPLGAKGELSWRPQSTRWVFQDVRGLVRRSFETRGAGPVSPFPGALSKCDATRNVFCPVGGAHVRAPAAAPNGPSKASYPDSAGAPQLIKASFVDAPPPNAARYPEPDAKQAPVQQALPQITKEPSKESFRPRPAPVKTPKPKPRPIPKDSAPLGKEAPAAPKAPAPTPSPDLSAYQPPAPPQAMTTAAAGMPPGPAATDGGGRGAAAACSRDGQVCIVTDGARLAGISADGGRRFYSSGGILRTAPSPTVEVTGAGRYVVHGVLARGDVTAGTTLATTPLRIDLAPTPARDGALEQVAGGLYHSGPADPLLALVWSNADLRRQATGGACSSFQPGPDAPQSAGETLCVGLFTGGRMLIYRLADDAQAYGEAWSRTVKTDADLSSVVFLDADHGYVSSNWSDKTPPRIFETRDHGRSWKLLKYGALPAPWVYLAGAVFLFAFVAALGRVMRRSETPAAGIEMAGVSDLPIGWRDADPMKLKPVAKALSRFVRNTQTKPPLTVAISGVWGSGKSSLMNLVYEDLKDRRVRPVWFNAWHHQKEDHLLAALLENVRTQATPPVWTVSGLNYRLRLLRHHGRDAANAGVLALLIVGIAALLVTLGVDKLATTAAAKGDSAVLDAAGVLKLLLPTLGLPTSIIAFLGIAGALAARMGLSPAALLASLKGNASLRELSGQLSFRYRFAEEFEDATQALRVGADAGLVIFIDDLDRCAPTNLMEILEAVNFLATAGPVFIFLGMDEERVVKAIATQPPIRDPAKKEWTDGDRIAAEEQARLYLRKLINVTVPVPEATLEGTMGLVDGEPEPPQPVWGPRLRRLARAAPDVVAPLAVAALLFTWVGVEIADASARQVALMNNRAAAAESVRAAAADAARRLADAKATAAADANSETARAAVASAEADKAQADAAASAAPAAASAAAAKPIPGWVWAVLAIGPVVVGVLIAALLLARRAVVVAFDQEEDSERFRDALKLWHPLVFLTDQTPRGVKRHQNRLRLKAMRLRPVEEPGFLDGLLRPRATPTSEPKVIPDEMLVALEALRQAGDGLLDDCLAGHAYAGPPHCETQVRADTAQAALDKFRKRFPEAWPPDAEQLAAFRTLDHAFGPATQV